MFCKTIFSNKLDLFEATSVILYVVDSNSFISMPLSVFFPPSLMFADKARSLPFEGTVSGEATEHYINDYLYSNLGRESLLVTSSQSNI